LQLNVVNATIEDTGNLVLRDAANAEVWQSFDSPTDTLLPDQTFEANSSKAVTAWAFDRDWRNGNYSLRWAPIDNLTATWQLPYFWNNSNYQLVSQQDYWSAPNALIQASLTRTGLFQGVDASGNASQIGVAANASEAPGSLVRLTLNLDGNLRMYSWSARNPNWTVEWMAESEVCNIPGYCGPYGICTPGTGGSCSCPDGFQFIDPNDTRLGCARTDPAAYCNQSAPIDRFTAAQSFDWPSNDLTYFQNENLSTCMQLCLASFKCEAVIAQIADSEGIIPYCYLKRAALLNGLPNTQRNSYLRVGGNSSRQSPDTHKGGHNSLVIVAATLGVAVGVISVLCCVAWSLLAARRMKKSRENRLQDKWMAAKGGMIRLSYREIVFMTGNFGTMIGEGGFGTVFKGHIGNDMTVAVKRLNKELSSRVEREFSNEVDSIGQIHHVHLVSLVGYCAEGNHRLLVYEYVERGSLDRVLFRSEKRGTPVLEWRPRFSIAVQTARGLAYLHDDCNQQIIHCDVKPENILLDHLFNVKVADFGISRIMKRGQTRIVTMQISGTRGYLAPEWTSDQLMSLITNKVDVFSYGMVLLEIISGRRNFMMGKVGAPDMYFPSWAFPKTETEEFMDVVDPALTGIVNPEEVRRALQVAFWCINGSPHMRPAMSEVVQMLQGHLPIDLPVPKPDYFRYFTLDVSDDIDYSALHWSTSGSGAIPVEEAHHGSVQLLSTSGRSGTTTL
jgi:serine/threonine protein kinase